MSKLIASLSDGAIASKESQLADKVDRLIILRICSPTLPTIRPPFFEKQERLPAYLTTSTQTLNVGFPRDGDYRS